MKLNKKTCSFDLCDKEVMAKTLCRSHYCKQLRQSKPKKIRPQRQPCSIQNCTKLNEAKGYCKPHYNQYVYLPKRALREPKKAKPLKVKKTIMPRDYMIRGTMEKVCDVDDCDRKARSKNYCHMHYARWKRHGDTGVNYHNRKKRTAYAINKSELTFTHSHEEVMILNEFFGEMVGFNMANE